MGGRNVYKEGTNVQQNEREEIRHQDREFRNKLLESLWRQQRTERRFQQIS